MCVYNTCVTLIGSTLQKYREETVIAVANPLWQLLVIVAHTVTVICRLGIFFKNSAMMDDLYLGIG